MTKLFFPVFFALLILVESPVSESTLWASTKTTNQPLKPTFDPYEIRLVTFAPHKSMFAWFGHSALEVKNNITGQSHMFNFGGFFFDLKHLIQFTFGKFTFWSFASESSRALVPYERENRHMVFQTLNLTSQQKTEIRRLLLYYLKPENRFYIYDHFLNNCSTKIRDIIDQALAGSLKKQSSQIAELTFRDYVHRMMAGVPYLDFILNFVLNDSVDKPITHWNTMFLPDRLMAVIQVSTNPVLGNVPLVSSRIEKSIDPETLFFTPKANSINTVLKEIGWGFFLLAIIGLSAIFYIKNHRYFQKVYPGLISVFGLIFGTPGLILFFMMCFTEHKDTFWNENILLLNPITLLLFFTGLAAAFGKLKTAFSWICMITGLMAFSAIGLKMLPMFDQANWQQIRVLLPVLLVVGITGMIDIIYGNRSQTGKLKS